MELSDVAALSDELFAVSNAAQPLGASVFGVTGLDDLMPDLSAAAEAEVAVRLRDIAARGEAIDPETLSDADRVTRAVLVHTAAGGATLYEDHHTELSMSGHASPVSALFQCLPQATPDLAPGLLVRLHGVPRYLAQAAVRATDGARAGRGVHARGLANTVDQVTAYLATPLDGDPFLQPALATPLAADVRQAVAEQVRPAMAEFLEVLRGPVTDLARPDDRPGLAYVPDGGGIYARALAFHTTTNRTPDEVHQAGLDLCASLREEYAQLGARVFETSDFEEITHRLRTDTGLRYDNPQDMLDEARGALARAEAALPDWFGTWHRAVCEVEPMNEVEAPSAVLGYYCPPAGDGSRPGRHWLNTYQPHTRTRYEYETLAFHESVPGHHLQLAVGQELGDSIPAFRRHGYIAAYSEGWGLYAERLCDEMELYSTDLARFGILSFDSWRATRLVVDTGLHDRGWTRRQAVDFMWANSALTIQNIENEVDRYIAWPGQACSYMTGRLEIQALRSESRAALGGRFDIKHFHDAVLLGGAVPLTVLRDEVTRWSTGGTA